MKRGEAKEKFLKRRADREEGGRGGKGSSTFNPLLRHWF